MSTHLAPVDRGQAAPGRAAGPAIVAEGLTRHYGPLVALDHLDLSVPAGSVFGFLGPNGAGKTTTLRLLTGLGRPTSGRAVVAGIEVGSDAAALGSRIGYLDQSPRLFGWMKGRELLEFAGRLCGLEGPALRARVGELLELVGLADAAERPIGGYSGGMRQRIGIAQAIVHRPAVLFLDEPVSALDPEGRRDVLALLEDLRPRTTVFMSTHILSDVERICDRVAIVDHGRLVTEAAIAELLERYARPAYEIAVDQGQGQGLRAIAERLAARPWVETVASEGSTLRVAVTDSDRAADEILPVVAGAGIRVTRLERVRPTLEDVFMELVGRDQADGQEAA
jgi:ABC-2 type transport system ATP-binding protein